MSAPALVDCPTCGGSGFAGRGSGYDAVCPECGGNKVVPAGDRDDETCTECKGTGWDRMRERECDCVREP